MSRAVLRRPLLAARAHGLDVPPRSARSLGINTSTVSCRIGRFEDELGLAMFERGHAGVRLTTGGKAVLQHVRRALAELDAIRHAGDRNGKRHRG